MKFKNIFGTILVCLLFISACKEKGDPVTPPTNNPAISSIAPDSGAVGDTITINGTNFGASQGSSTISFGSVAAGAAVSWSDTRIKVKVPTNTVTGNVTITIGGITSNAMLFAIIGSVATVSFATDILQNIFISTPCTGCHGGTNNLFLTSYASVMQGNSTRGPVVVPGDTNSLLIRKLKGGTSLSSSEGVRMPRGGNPISDSDLRKVVAWIKEGAQNN